MLDFVPAVTVGRKKKYPPGLCDDAILVARSTVVDRTYGAHHGVTKLTPVLMKKIVTENLHLLKEVPQWQSLVDEFGPDAHLHTLADAAHQVCEDEDAYSSEVNDVTLPYSDDELDAIVDLFCPFTPRKRKRTPKVPYSPTENWSIKNVMDSISTPRSPRTVPGR